MLGDHVASQKQGSNRTKSSLAEGGPYPQLTSSAT